MDDPLAILSRHPYFASLPPNILAAIRDRLIRRHYEKAALIYSEGQPSQGLYLVESGTVRIFKSSADGREQDLHHIATGQSFSDAAALDGAPTIANAEAMEPAVVLLVPRDALRGLIMRYPEIGLSISHVLAQRVRELSALVGELSLRHVVSRLATVLLRLPDPAPSPSFPPSTSWQRRSGQSVRSPRGDCDTSNVSAPSGSSRAAAPRSSTATSSTTSPGLHLHRPYISATRCVRCFLRPAVRFVRAFTLSRSQLRDACAVT